MSEQYNPGFWDQACSTPPPVRRLYLVRMLFLVVPALTLVYFFEAIGLDPIGAVPLMYLSLHGWFAVAYARNKSMGLVMVGNLLSALAASVITGFFAYILVFIHGPRTLWKLLGGLVPHSDHLDYGLLRDRDFMLPHIRLPDLPQVPLPCRT